MKLHEIRELSTDDIKSRISEEEGNLIDLRFTHQLKQLTNTAKLKLTRKDIAKLKTVLKEREMEAKKSDKNEGVN
jgi:large subunit ribosomal protein L29